MKTAFDLVKIVLLLRNFDPPYEKKTKEDFIFSQKYLDYSFKSLSHSFSSAHLITKMDSHTESIHFKSNHFFKDNVEVNQYCQKMSQYF